MALAPTEAFPRAKRAANLALEFDPTLAEAHTSLAHIHLEFDHDWEAAEKEKAKAAKEAKEAEEKAAAKEAAKKSGK